MPTKQGKKTEEVTPTEIRTTKSMSENDVKDAITKAVDVNVLLNLSNDDWDDFLIPQCGVYMIDGDKYIAKRFNMINYLQVSKDKAGELLVENANFILKNVVFKVHSNDVYKRINEIISRYRSDPTSYIINLNYKTDSYTDEFKLKDLPATCIAFANGVYDFVKDDWLIVYTKDEIEGRNQQVITYPREYVIWWYFNFNFHPIEGLNVMDYDKTEDFLDIIRTGLCPKGQSHNNYIFELIWNMSHDENGTFSQHKFEHLCKIMGYMIYQKFSDNFVILIGNGQNGKNTLFDSCLKSKIVPQPTGQSLDDIEDDKFVTASFLNKYQNIYLETESKTITKSMRLKNLTGSQYQTVEQKGVDKFDAILNCKMLFSANNKDKVKFTDSTHGLLRRINLCELFYRWDKSLNYMKTGDQDWYDTTCSEDLHEITGYNGNVMMYCYLAMYGIKLATQGFTKSFDFGKHNDWNSNQYIDYNIALFKKVTTQLAYGCITKYIAQLQNAKKYKEIESLLKVGKTSIFELSKFKSSEYAKTNNYKDFFNDLGKYFDDGEISSFETNDLYNVYEDNNIEFSVVALMKMVEYPNDVTSFVGELKKMFPQTNIKVIDGIRKIPLKIDPDSKMITVVTNK